MSEILKGVRKIGLAGAILIGGTAVTLPEAQASTHQVKVAETVDPNLAYNCEEAAMHSVTGTWVNDVFTSKGQESNFYKSFGAIGRNVETVNGGPTYGKESCVGVDVRKVYIGAVARQNGREIILTTPITHTSFGNEPLEVNASLGAFQVNAVERDLYGTNELCANNVSAIKEDVLVTAQSTKGGTVYGQTVNLPWVPTHCPAR